LRVIRLEGQHFGLPAAPYGLAHWPVKVIHIKRAHNGIRKIPDNLQYFHWCFLPAATPCRGRFTMPTADLSAPAFVGLQPATISASTSRNWLWATPATSVP